jgi:multidrug efflux pump subunit AcrB
LTVRVTGQLKNAEDVANLPIMLSTGGVIHLKDVAEVKLV